jgi:YD repeat-containing protein
MASLLFTRLGRSSHMFCTVVHMLIAFSKTGLRINDGKFTVELMCSSTSRVTSFGYDVDGELTAIDYPAGTPDVSYAYDPAGNVTSMSDG